MYSCFTPVQSMSGQRGCLQHHIVGRSCCQFLCRIVHFKPKLIAVIFLGVFFYWAWCSSKAAVHSDKILEIIHGVFHVLYFDLSLSQLRVNETALKVIGLFLQITAVDTPTICQTCRKAGKNLRNMGSRHR